MSGVRHLGLGGAAMRCAPLGTRRCVVMRVVTRRVDVAPIGVPSISQNSAALRGRSAGDFSMAARIASSTSSGVDDRTMRMLGTASIACFAMIAVEFLPVNGGSPASISKSMHPRL
jgi:hypothetical protein